MLGITLLLTLYYSNHFICQHCSGRTTVTAVSQNNANVLWWTMQHLLMKSRKIALVDGHWQVRDAHFNWQLMRHQPRLFIYNKYVAVSQRMLRLNVLPRAEWRETAVESLSPALSHWLLFQFCQAYTRTIQKNGKSHWSCMMANKRSADQFCQQNWQDLANKIYLVCCKRFGGWQDRSRSTCTLGRHLACGLKRQCFIKRL